MSRPRFLADHDLNEFIIYGVMRREPALEFLHVREVGARNWSDARILEFAAGNGLIVVSHDVDTMTSSAYERISAGAEMAGLFMVRQSDPISATMDDLILVWSASEADEWINQVVFFPL